MNKIPLVSILMNCFNGEIYLDEAIKSIIQQSYKNWELIFWDNKSLDNSIKIISSYRDERIRIFQSSHHTNLGEARKRAYEKVRGDFLAFLDVDDIWHKEKLSSQIKDFDNKDIGISFTNSLYFSKRSKKNLYNPNSIIKVNTSSLITNYPLSLNTIMLRTKRIKELNYVFDENFSHICDFDLIVRLSTISKVKYLNKILSGWRIHGNNESLEKKGLFNQEKKQWCEIHLKKNTLLGYIKAIKELKLLTEAEDRILAFGFSSQNSIDFNLKNISNKKNLFFIILSFIPILPKFIFAIKNYLFRFRWL